MISWWHKQINCYWRYIHKYSIFLHNGLKKKIGLIKINNQSGKPGNGNTINTKPLNISTTSSQEEINKFSRQKIFTGKKVLD